VGCGDQRVGGEDVFTQREQPGDGAGRSGRDVVAAAAPGFGDGLVASELAEVVGSLADDVSPVAGYGVGLVSEVCDAEAVRGRGQCGDASQGGTGAGFAQVNAADGGLSGSPTEYLFLTHHTLEQVATPGTWAGAAGRQGFGQEAD
jgi:hypothetical protein